MRFFPRTSLVLLTCALLVGCGNSNMIKAKGRITKDGKPFTFTNAGLRIFLQPVDLGDSPKYTQYPAMFHMDGTFQVTGNDGQGLPPGKYRVTMQLIQKKEDVWRGQLSGPKSPFVCEVTPANQEIVINLDEAKLPEPNLE